VPIRRGESEGDAKGVLAHRPTRMILTQFDYYRRYRAVVEQVRSNPAVAEIVVENTARVRSPDSYPAMQKVVQHISWAPVIVKISWR